VRIQRLDLLRYGHFTDLFLELPDGRHDFHILFGPNEAGKSTVLSAIEDLLFGIPHNSPFNFRHDYSTMRIGSILSGDGESLEVRRRKGRQDTLLTPDEVPLPAGEGALAPFLGGVDRDFFTRMFSLDHVRLRQGGREILEAQDEVGQVLFSAGAGISGLREILRNLQEQADGLWGTRRAARRRYFQAEDRLKEAADLLRGTTVTAAKWTQLRRERNAARAAYEAIEKEIEEKSAQQRRLSRIRRVYRFVRETAELDAAIADLFDARRLPEDALDRLDAAEAEDRAAAARIEVLAGQLEELRQGRSELKCDETLLLHENDVEQLHERRIKVRDGRADLPKRRAELAAAEADLQRLAVELGWEAASVEEIIGRVPTRAKVATLRTLLNQRSGRLAAVESARAAREEAEARADELREQEAAIGPSTDVSTLAAVTRAARAKGDIAARIGAAEAEVENAETDVQRILESPAPPVADEAALRSLSAPSRDAVLEYRDSLREVDLSLNARRREIRTAGNELERQRKASERMSREEGAVGLDDLARSRTYRDAGWSLVRRRYVDGASMPEEELKSFAGPDEGLVEAYEKAVKSADGLSDLRFDKAESAARLAVILRQIAEQEELIEKLERDRQALVEEGRSLDSKWREMWSDAPFSPLSPDAMLDWLTARDDALQAMERRAKAEKQLHDLRRQEADARNGVLKQLGADKEMPVTQPLAVVLEAAADVLRAHEKAAENKRRLEESHRQARSDVERKAKALGKNETAWSDWERQWADAVEAVGLDPSSGPEAVASQADAIDEMRTSVVKVHELRHERIGKIEQTVDGFIRDVARLVGFVAPDLAETESEEAVLRLESRLSEASRIRDLRRQKDDTIAELEEQIGKHETSRRAAREVVSHLRDLAGVEDAAQLRTAIERSDRLRRAEAERERLLETLVEEGDGLSAADLASECAAVDVDQVAAREDSISRELDELRNRLLDARESLATAKQAFEAVGGKHAAARAEAARQEALAEMMDVAERYVRLRSSALLLQWAIDRYRREKQAPLLRKAGDLFATLTGGSFGTLRVDFDERDQALLTGVRPDETIVRVSGMSTGTADQLYLALRIASVADYLDRAPHLPFVADDLFVNFDDERAAAGFQVLNQLSQQTQVLFFTHHRHLVDVARSALGSSVSLIELT
jgi:uncharacterized protein YhaN